MYSQHFQQRKDQPGMVSTPARGQLNRENKLFPFPFPVRPGRKRLICIINILYIPFSDDLNESRQTK